MSDRPSRILARIWLALPRRIVPSLNLDMFYIFLGIRHGSPYLLLGLAKDDRDARATIVIQEPVQEAHTSQL